MGEINIPDDEKAALRGIDVYEMKRLIAECVAEERIDALSALPLSECGPYVSRELEGFEHALSDLQNAKSAPKRDRTQRDAHRAGDNYLPITGISPVKLVGALAANSAPASAAARTSA